MPVEQWRIFTQERISASGEEWEPFDELSAWMVSGGGVGGVGGTGTSLYDMIHAPLGAVGVTKQA